MDGFANRLGEDDRHIVLLAFVVSSSALLICTGWNKFCLGSFDAIDAVPDRGGSMGMSGVCLLVFVCSSNGPQDSFIGAMEADERIF